MSYLKKFNFDLRGDATNPKLVFLHGLMGSWTNWRRILPTFEARYQILSYDQRGHGKSFRPESGYSPEDFAEDLKNILDELGWKTIDLVGHSMGGRNALVFAFKYPERVRCLVIEDIGPEGNQKSVERIERILAKVPTPFYDKRLAKETILKAFSDQVLAQYLYSNIAEVEPGVFDWRFSKNGVLLSVREGRAHDRWQEWRGLTVPTLLVRGENSDELDHDMYEKMLRENANVKGVVISKASHWVHFDNAEAFIAAVDQFLGGSEFSQSSR